MYKFTALGDGDNATAFALGSLARDLTDAEYKAASAAGLLSEEAAALFEHVPDGGDGPRPARRAKPEEGIDDVDSGREGA